MKAQLISRTFLSASIFIAGLMLIFTGHVLLGITLHFIFFAILLWGTLNPSSKLFGPIITHTEKDIWLTIDDGPDPQDTPLILDLLDKYEVKATFFVIGAKAEKYPELIRIIDQRGHQIGNHTYSHPQASFWCAGPVRTYQEITKCQKALEAILGKTPTLFRAPVGHHNLFVQPVLKYCGLSQIVWNCRGFDAVSTPANTALSRLTNSMRSRSIILVHEATPIALEVVSGVLAHAQKKGWKISLQKN